MARAAEVVIVGGGIVGCATAYFLARAGVGTTLIEKEAVGSCASGFAAGLLDPMRGDGVPGPLEPLCLESFRMHLRLADEVFGETGVDPQFRPMASIWTAFSEAESPELPDLFDTAQRLEGFSARWLDGSDLRSLEPRLSPNITRALYVEGLRQVACYEYTLALVKAAERYGATVRHGAVRGLRHSGRRISGIDIGGEEVPCDKVVLAMGPWTGQVGAWLGTPVPVEPLKGQILRLKLAGPPLGHTIYPSGGGYISSKPDGLIWAGTTEEHVGFDDRSTPEARDSIMRDALTVMPTLSGARVALQTACLRPASEDGLPILGAAPGWDGVYLATGAGRKGILLAPAMAQATADLVTTGHTELPIAPFHPDRFTRT